MNVYEIVLWVSVAALILAMFAIVLGCLKVLSDCKFDDDDNRDDDCGV